MRQQWSVALAELPPDIKTRLLHWAAGFSTACYYDNNTYTHYTYQRYECLVGVKPVHTLELPVGQCFDGLKAFARQHQDWLFGTLSYDLKNETEQLDSQHPDNVKWPALFFFVPETVAYIKGDKLTIETLTTDAEAVYQQIITTQAAVGKPYQHPTMNTRFTREEYIHTIEAIREHIAAGDVYELNLCQEFYAEAAAIAPVTVFERLNKLAQAPFSAYVKHNDRYLLCASPERFLLKQDDKLVSQPIKGTAKRGSTAAEDEQQRLALAESIKEQAENVMIVDLVRNDLTRSCRTGTIKVEELFGIYSFPTVHQMVSTISGQLRPEVHWVDAIRRSFPMGSMTGTPKIIAMELIERYERSRRGLYSGAVGYITPHQDFDFNVVIRSLLYNRTDQYLSYQAGGAITYDSNAEAEYEESMLKAAVLEQVLG